MTGITVAGNRFCWVSDGAQLWSRRPQLRFSSSTVSAKPTGTHKSSRRRRPRIRLCDHHVWILWWWATALHYQRLLPEVPDAAFLLLRVKGDYTGCCWITQLRDCEFLTSVLFSVILTTARSTPEQLFIFTSSPSQTASPFHPLGEDFFTRSSLLMRVIAKPAVACAGRIKSRDITSFRSSDGRR